MLKSKYLVGSIGFITLLMISGALIGPAMAADENEDPLITSEPGTEVPIDPTSPASPAYGECWIENVMWGKIGWSNEIFVLVINYPQEWIEIHLYDRFWVGDFYELWEISPVGEFKGVTPQVDTDYHHGPDPEDPPFIAHTGTGTVYSDATFTVVKEPGVYKYRVRDPFFEHDPGYAPAGFYIEFTKVHPAPELPVTVPLVVSLIVIVLVPLKRKLWNK